MFYDCKAASYAARTCSHVLVETCSVPLADMDVQCRQLHGNEKGRNPRVFRGYGNTYHGFLAQTELIYAGVLDLHSATNTYKRAPDSGFLFIEMVRNGHVKIL